MKFLGSRYNSNKNSCVIKRPQGWDSNDLGFHCMLGNIVM